MCVHWGAAPALPPRFSRGRSAVRIHAPGRIHIGGVAYWGWALPPNAGGMAYRHVQGHRHTTASLTTAQ